METKTYTITLATGVMIANLMLNGNNFISDEDLTEDTFAGKLYNVTITDSEGNTETIENGELISLYKEDGKTWFIIRETPVDVLKERKIQSDIQYIAMMADVDLEV